MANGTRIPPPPVTSEDKTIWNNWYVAVKDAINNLRAALTWTLLDFTGSNLTDIVTKSHQVLDNLQGGSVGERYHLTSTQATAIASFNGTYWTDLTDGGTTTLHSHDLYYKNSATLDFGSINSNTTAELTITVTGATVGYPVLLGAPAGLEADLMFCGYVSAANTVTVRIHNSSGSAIDPASATWYAAVPKSMV